LGCCNIKPEIKSKVEFIQNILIFTIKLILT
jgi:hypothetical protein